MFNPERLLGNLLMKGVSGGLKSKKLRKFGKKAMTGGFSGGQMAMGMGALGVAMAAFEHFTQKDQIQYVPPGAQPQMNPVGTYPVATPPPPPPPPGVAAAPPTPPGATAANPQLHEEALLLIRAMVAAANADGVLDETEREKILSKFSESELSEEEKVFLENELNTPPSLNDIVKKVNSPVLAQQVYTVSVLAIELDTDEERDYLKQLAQRLFLDEATVKEIHDELEPKTEDESIREEN